MDKYKPIKAFIEKAHRNSQRVAFTHGCFDLLHLGHVQTLKESKILADVLIVGVDSDALVSKIKGPSRPIIKDEDRSEKLLELKVVDMAFVLDPDFNEQKDLYDFFKKLYEYLKIDLVTAGNPSANSVDQKAICEELGIEFKLAGVEIRETTTAIIEKIKKC